MARNFSVGTSVRSYDFPGNYTCYIEGLVIAIEADYYVIKVAREVWQGKQVDPLRRMTVRAPLNGLRSFGGRETEGVVAAPAPIHRSASMPFDSPF